MKSSAKVAVHPVVCTVVMTTKNGCDLSSIQSYCYFTRAPHRQQATAANGSAVALVIVKAICY